MNLRVFVITCGGWHGNIKSVRDENTFMVQNDVGKLVAVDLYDIRGLNSEIAPIIQNPK